jgi:hypothetical protein
MKTRVFTTVCVVIFILFGVTNFSVANSDLLQFNGHKQRLWANLMEDI